MTSASPILTSPNGHLPFFRFPPEIRVQIYSELLIHSGPIVMRVAENDGTLSLPQFKGLYPDLLRVNK
jgi:hypothetical protein